MWVRRTTARGGAAQDFAVAPDLGVSVEQEREVEAQVAEGMRQFLQQHYSLHDRSRPTEFIGGACDRHKFQGEASIKALFGLLQSQPTLILESEVAGDRLNFRIAYWGLNDGNYYYQTIAKIPYREILIDSAQQRAISWKTLRSQLIAAGEDPALVDDLEPQLPQLLSTLLQEPIERSLIEAIVGGYRQMYGALAASRQSWLPELYLQLAQSLSHLPDRTWARAQLEESVRVWLELRQVSVEASWLCALQSQVRISDRDYVRALRDCLAVLEDPDAVAELDAILVTFDRRRLVHPIVSTDNFPQLIHKLSGHTAAVSAIAIDPQGCLLASGGLDRAIHVWDLQGGERVQTFTGHTMDISAIAICPDGKIELWNLETGELIRSLAGHQGAVQALVLSPDGQLVTASQD